MRTAFMFISLINAMSSTLIFGLSVRPESGQNEWRSTPLSRMRWPFR